jgi:DNA-binding transcriptional ArsR family regulator
MGPDQRRNRQIGYSSRLRAVTPVPNIDDPRYVKALSHPLRVRILALLQERTASPRELAEWLDATLGTVSYHVRTLHDFGLIELVRTSQVRGAIAHHYRAKVRPRVSDEAWASAAPIVKQAAVGAALQTVDDYARASAAAGGFDRGEAQLSRTNLRLDPKGWQAAAKACTKLLADLTKVEEAAARRLAKDPHAEGVSDAAVVLLLFEAVKLSEADGDAPNGRAKRATRRRRTAKAEA